MKGSMTDTIQAQRAPWLNAFVLIGLTSTAIGQELKDFQNAVNYLQDEQGCRSIPYSSLQDSCVRKQADVKRWCEAVKSSCGDIDPKRLQADIERLKTDRDALKASKEELDRARSSLSDDSAKRQNEEKTKEIDNKLYELGRTKDTLERQVAETSKSVSDRYEAAKSCRDARREVMGVFNDAISSANSDRQRGNPEIAAVAQTLIDGWTAGNLKHEEPRRNAANSVEICEKVLYEIGHLGSF